MQSALLTRGIIGQAKGMIMERFDVDAVRAFELLTALSQQTNTKLNAVAAQIVQQGRGSSDPRDE
ncbi:ANTAR domain-containing protein [Rhodococcus sp. (in: high G+C Gram-positive bacteria)]|uniref:ANTAR domain-containing protein n=1 Tax=Rhodococcus sp. TaxID=1831 RepID=UPI003BAE52DE